MLWLISCFPVLLVLRLASWDFPVDHLRLPMAVLVRGKLVVPHLLAGRAILGVYWQVGIGGSGGVVGAAALVAALLLVMAVGDVATRCDEEDTEDHGVGISLVDGGV